MVSLAGEIPRFPSESSTALQMSPPYKRGLFHYLALLAAVFPEASFIRTPDTLRDRLRTMIFPGHFFRT
jgi:hypothetical protein